VFLDTGAFVALRNRAEREHEAARETLAALVADRAQLLTSNYVFSETYTALLVRVGREEAIRWGQRFRSGAAIELVRIDEPLEERAWSILESHADKLWSHVDATSFALMEREAITEAFAFDHHFAQRGLTLMPGSPRGV
jgi:predicted nucleic acid-binding protein